MSSCGKQGGELERRSSYAFRLSFLAPFTDETWRRRHRRSAAERQSKPKRTPALLALGTVHFLAPVTLGSI